jgi:hypothetical protein
MLRMQEHAACMPGVGGCGAIYKREGKTPLFVPSILLGNGIFIVAISAFYFF